MRTGVNAVGVKKKRNLKRVYAEVILVDPIGEKMVGRVVQARDYKQGR